MEKIGIALSGGVARCIAHLGVLEVFLNAGIPIHAVAGTSGGSLVGALFVSGRFKIPELIEITRGLSWWKLTRPVASRRGLLSSDRIRIFLEDRIGSMEFSEALLPFGVVATDLLTGTKVVITEGKLSQAVQASCSLPVIFRPTFMNGRWLVDGGMVSQIPVLAVKEDLRMDRVIAVDVNYKGMDLTRTPGNSIQIAVHLVSLSARKNAEIESKFSDFLVQVNAEGIALTDLRKGEILLERGRRAAEQVVPGIKSGLGLS